MARAPALTPLLASLLALALTAVSACTSPPSAQGLPHDALDEAIGRTIGDPNTCVLLADRATGRVVYRYGAASTCTTAWPACDRAGTLRAGDTVALGAQTTRNASCDSAPGRRVGWSAGPAPGARPLTYAAVMEGERALPGIEIQTRLEGALRGAGL